ncbi:hypothetical protein Cenrod_1557 [Candidatus Symbiobacter mobilis CR]|uniref:Uncharacterized protein n=1 Tax=Candidatus Symbiobacter mobilis CR TaxID=946483 RepID=U5N8B5_9BURK|nr:hypothetical protein Cenrod_1557 [Candidatus Symbiobacter mobilis CR]
MSVANRGMALVRVMRSSKYAKTKYLVSDKFSSNSQTCLDIVAQGRYGFHHSLFVSFKNPEGRFRFRSYGSGFLAVVILTTLLFFHTSVSVAYLVFGSWFFY